MSEYIKDKVEQAAFEEEVNFILFAILEKRVDLDEYFTRKDDEEFNNYKEWE